MSYTPPLQEGDASPLNDDIRSQQLDLRIEESLKKLEDKNEDLSLLLQQIVQIMMLLSHQNHRISREFIQDMIPEIRKQTEAQAGSYKDWKVIALNIGAGVLQILAGAYGAYGVTRFLGAGLPLKTVQGLMGLVAQKSAFTSTAGQVIGQGSGLVEKWNEGGREVRRYEIKLLEEQKGLQQQSSQTASGKVSEQSQVLRQLISAAHQTAYQILGQSS